jgi:hypothetical protein
MTNKAHFSGLVTVSQGEVQFQGFSVQDAVVVAEFQSAFDNGVDPAEFAFSLLEIGARTAALRSNTAGAEKIEASITQAKNSISETAQNVERAVKKQISELSSEDGQLIKGIEGIVKTYQDEVETLTAGEDSELRKTMLKLLQDAKEAMSKDVLQTVDKQRLAIAELLDPSNPTSPLRPLAEKVEGIAESFQNFTRSSEVDDAVAEVLEVGITGGFDYETLAVNATQRVASMAGDDCEHTGARTGRTPSKKKGDGVVDLKVGGKVFARVVLEAKNSNLTKKQWEAEISGAKANRGASGFIGFCKHLEDMPNNSKILIFDPQTIVMQFNPETEDLTFLALVYQIVKMNTLNAAGSLEGLDIAELNMNLDDSLASLEEFTELVKSASTIENQAKSIKLRAASIKEKVTKHVTAVRTSIAREIDSHALPNTSGSLEIEHSDPDSE